MSGCLMVYSVNMDRLLATCGSGDKRLIQTLSRRYKHTIDLIFEDAAEAGITHWTPDGEFLPVRHLIMGKADSILPGDFYGYGFKFIVEHMGYFLDNHVFCPTRLNFILDEAETLLKASGATVRLSDLVMRGSPVAFPPPEGYPMIGYWRPDEIHDNNARLRGAALDRGVIASIRAWLAYAASRNEGIIGVYY
jgi:hypothetical protein